MFFIYQVYLITYITGIIYYSYLKCNWLLISQALSINYILSANDCSYQRYYLLLNNEVYLIIHIIGIICYFYLKCNWWYISQVLSITCTSTAIDCLYQRLLSVTYISSVFDYSYTRYCILLIYQVYLDIIGLCHSVTIISEILCDAA